MAIGFAADRKMDWDMEIGIRKLERGVQGRSSPYSLAALSIQVLAFFALLSWALSARAADMSPRLLVLGDSLTSGYGLAAQDGFPAKLEAALRARGRDIDVVDSGISGDTTAGGRARLPWAMAEPPRWVILELGANDGLRGLPPKDTEINLDAIIIELKRRRIAVLLAGMRAPPNLGREYGQAFDGLYPRLAKVHNISLYPFFLDGVAGERTLTQNDGLHPNAQGVEVIVERILPHVLKLIGRP
ncbi:MAG: arylesterase [Alphaproteobacteria bacterium]